MNSIRCLTGALVVLVLALVSLPANAQVSISLDIAPPPLVVESQPACPDDGYIWTPGYWSYDDNAGEYYWVPGAWVQPPEVGLYWTPAYWGWDNGAYAFYPGYWGPTVGFYGGVNYGHGYWGNGYGGGRWDNGHFAYNTAANNVQGGRVHNTYADKSMYQPRTNRTSFNGGRGGIQAQPTPQQQVANRIPATPQQQSHFQMAAKTHTHPVKVNAHNTAANQSAPATAHAQGAQQPGGTQAQTHVQSPVSGWNNAAQKPANTSGNSPTVNKQDAALTGGDAEAQREHEAASNQAKQDNKPHVAEQPAQKPEPVANHEVKMDTQPHVAEQPAQVHPQGSGPAPSVSHDTHLTAPEVHAQAAPHIEAKPQGPAAGAKPEAKADGQGKPGDQPGH